MTELLQQQLLRVQQHMKSQADKHRTERSFEVGDQVWLKLQPYVQTSVASRSNHKLNFRYFGPYEIESRVGTVAYKLKLPPSSSVHPVFHVSLLKKAQGVLPSVVSTLPTDLAGAREPELVLDERLQNKNHRVVQQLLIKWKNWPVELTTWEDEDQVRHLLPARSACGQAVDLGGKNVMIKEGAKRLEVDSEAEEILRGGKTGRIKKPSTRVYGPKWVSK